MDSSDGGRKWALAKAVFTASTAMAVGTLVFSVSGKIETTVSSILEWWSFTQAGLLALYNGANVIAASKGAKKNDPDPVP